MGCSVGMGVVEVNGRSEDLTGAGHSGMDLGPIAHSQYAESHAQPLSIKSTPCGQKKERKKKTRCHCL